MHTLTLTPEELETVIACIHARARVIGNASPPERALQEALYSLASRIDIQTNPPTTITYPQQTERLLTQSDLTPP